MKRITFVVSDDITKQLDELLSLEKRSIQKEIEWLIAKRLSEVKKGEK